MSDLLLGYDAWKLRGPPEDEEPEFTCPKCGAGVDLDDEHCDDCGHTFPLDDDRDPRGPFPHYGDEDDE